MILFIHSFQVLNTLSCMLLTAVNADVATRQQNTVPVEKLTPQNMSSASRTKNHAQDDDRSPDNICERST